MHSKASVWDMTAVPNADFLLNIDSQFIYEL